MEMMKGLNMLKKTIVECDLCDRCQEIDSTEGTGFFICQDCWKDLKFSIQNPILENRTRATI